MRVVFPYFNVFTRPVPPFFNFAISGLSAFLKRHGHETSMVYVDELIPEENLLDLITPHKPDLIALSVVTSQWASAKFYLPAIKGKFKVPIICGGWHATALPEQVIGHPCVDAVCIGEGEEAVLEITDALEAGRDFSAIRNLWVKTGNGIVRNPVRPIIKRIESLPWPDRKIFHSIDYLRQNCLGELPMLAGRGCPYSCSYCSNLSFSRWYGTKGKPFRLRPPQDIVNEINYLRSVSEAPITHVCFFDDLFLGSKSWMEEFRSLYKAQVGLPFVAEMAVKAVYPGFLEILRDAGCAKMHIGIECGNEEYRKKVLRKNFSNHEAVSYFSEAHRLGIETLAFVMAMMPGETEEMICETIDFIRHIKPNYTNVSPFQPNPGTELYELCLKNNLIDPAIDERQDSRPAGVPLYMIDYWKKTGLLHRFHEICDVALELSLKKRPKGYLDLLSYFSSKTSNLQIEGVNQFDCVHINVREKRLALLQKPPAKSTFSVQLCKNSLFKTKIGVDIHRWIPKGNGYVNFFISTNSGSGENTIFSTKLMPSKSTHDFFWREVALDLSGYGEGVMQISLETQPCYDEPCEVAWVAWEQPHIEVV